MNTAARKNCSEFRALVDRYVEGDLGSTDTAFVAHHADTCASCRQILATATGTRDAVRALRLRPIPSTFDTAIASRIREVNQNRSWPRLEWLTSALGPTGLMRPSLAVTAFVLMVTVGVVTRTHSPSPQPAAPMREAALVSQCVAQHQSYVAAEPLSDWSSQNLAGHINGLAPDRTDDSL